MRSMVWGRQPWLQPITELYFHHFKIAFDIGFTKNLNDPKKLSANSPQKRIPLMTKLNSYDGNSEPWSTKRKLLMTKTPFWRFFLKFKIKKILFGNVLNIFLGSFSFIEWRIGRSFCRSRNWNIRGEPPKRYFWEKWKNYLGLGRKSPKDSKWIWLDEGRRWWARR